MEAGSGLKDKFTGRGRGVLSPGCRKFPVSPQDGLSLAEDHSSHSPMYRPKSVHLSPVMWRKRFNNFVCDIVLPEEHHIHTSNFDLLSKTVPPPKFYLLSAKEHVQPSSGKTDQYRRYLKASEAYSPAAGAQRVNDMAIAAQQPTDLEPEAGLQPGGMPAAQRSRSMAELRCGGGGPDVVAVGRAASMCAMVRQHGSWPSDAGSLCGRLLRG